MSARDLLQYAGTGRTQKQAAKVERRKRKACSFVDGDGNDMGLDHAMARRARK
eukprot:COSAG02_NODE_49069_length_329_cov_0.895652_1_plen_52_part_01